MVEIQTKLGNEENVFVIRNTKKKLMPSQYSEDRKKALKEKR